MLRWNAVCIDCADAPALAAFYCGLLGFEIAARDRDWFALRDTAGGVGLNIQGDSGYEPPVWPERADAQQKMLHFEIEVDDVDAAVAFAIDAGATVAPHQPADRDERKLRVMLDPAGHPFCLWSE
jgi:catechol 2,3-dioxygenase-like lactoylglutathione lyase family enzyme